MSRKPYVRPTSNTTWWLAQPRYMRYMAREASSLFICAYTTVVVIGLIRLAQGLDTWNAFLELMQSPLSVAFHLLALAFALYHTTTWFNVTPKAMPVQIGSYQLPGGVIVAAHYLSWIVVSVLVLYFAGAT